MMVGGRKDRREPGLAGGGDQPNALIGDAR
jgi:hypothetical protein